MKLMIVSPIVSHPPISGARMRINKLASYLKKLGHHITFIHYNIEGAGKKAQLLMENSWDKYINIPKTKKFEKSCNKVYGVDDWYEDKITDIILTECKNKKFDIIITNYVFMTKFLEKIPKEILKIIDTHDILSGRLEMYLKNGIEPGFFYTNQEEEKKGLNRADIVFAIQDIEAKYFSENTTAEVITINHLEDQRFIMKKYNKLQKIGFLGANNKFNIKSIEEFIKEFKKYNELEIKLYIAGNICNALKLADNRVELVGFVENPRDFYEEMDLIINPTIIGTGLKIKSIEALSFGVPIVSTKIGFDGVNSTLKEHNLENSKELMSCIYDIYSNPTKLNIIANYSEKLFKLYIESNQFKLFKLFPPDYKSISSEIRNNVDEKKVFNAIDSFEKFLRISFFKSPIKKLKAYKNVLKEYRDTK